MYVFKYINETFDFDHWFKPHDPNISHVHNLFKSLWLEAWLVARGVIVN